MPAMLGRKFECATHGPLEYSALLADRRFYYATQDVMRYIMKKRKRKRKHITPSSHIVICPGKLEVFVFAEHTLRYANRVIGEDWKIMVCPNEKEDVFIIVHGTFISNSEVGVGTKFFSNSIEVVDEDKDNQYFYADVLNMVAETIWDSLGWYGKFKRFLMRVDRATMFLFM